MEATQPRSTEPKRWKKVRDVFAAQNQDGNSLSPAHRRWNTVVDAVAPMGVVRTAARTDPRPFRTFEATRSSAQTRRNNALDALPVIEDESMHTKLATFREKRTSDEPIPVQTPMREDSKSNRRIDASTNSTEDETTETDSSTEIRRNVVHARRNTVIGMVTEMAEDLVDLMENPEPMLTVEEAAGETEGAVTLTTSSTETDSSSRMPALPDELFEIVPQHAIIEDSQPLYGVEPVQNEAAMATMQPSRDVDEAQRRQTEVTEASPAEVVTDEEWGSPEDVQDLNSEILSCLEIEGIAPPQNLFVESVENFRSVAHYYVNAMKLLDAPGIDLFASLSSRLGEDHVLVKGMKGVMAEMSNVTFITREPTDVREERHRAGAGIALPGLKQFSDESRSLSWVVRTAPLPSRQRENDNARHRGRLEPISASIEGSSRLGGARGLPKEEEAQIVCPGLPVSFDGFEQPPPLTQVQPRRSSSKRPLLSRLRSCLCFPS